MKGHFIRLLFLPSLAVSFLNGYAQVKYAKKPDLRLGVGIYSRPYIKAAKDNGQDAFFIPILSLPSVRGSGVLNTGAEFSINENLQGGMSITYQTVSVDHSTYDFKYKVSQLAIMPLVNYKYRQGRGNYIYSGGSIGAAFSHVSSKYGTTSSRKLAYQVTAFGVRTEHKYSGVLELGYGYKGIVVVEFSAKL